METTEISQFTEHSLTTVEVIYLAKLQKTVAHSSFSDVAFYCFKLL